MKKKAYSPERIVKLLREVAAAQSAGQTVEQACLDLGVAESSCHRWRGQYCGMQTGESRRLKELEKDNERLKRVVTDLTLDKLILEEAARGN